MNCPKPEKVIESHLGTITCFMKIAFSKDKIQIDENIDIKNQSSFAPTIQLKNKPWKTQVVPEVTTCYFNDAEKFFSATE